MDKSKRNNQAGLIQTIATIIVLGVVLAGLFFYWQYKNDKNLVCIEVTVKAKNPLTGEVKEFGNTCEVPKGWQEIESDAVNKQIYRSSKFGFEVTLPEGWEVRETTSPTAVEDLAFYSPRDQAAIDTFEKECAVTVCMGGYYPPGIGFRAVPYNDSVAEERGTKTINGVNWRIRVYEAAGLGIVAYETQVSNRFYGFEEFLAHDVETRKSQKFEQLLATFKPL